MNFRVLLPFLGLLISLSLCAQPESGMQVIAGHDPRIEASGAWFSHRNGDTIEYSRFSPEIFAAASGETFAADKARTTAGVLLRFTTDSPVINVVFKILPGERRGLTLAVSENGAIFETLNPSHENDTVKVGWDSHTPREVSTFDVLLPHWSNLGLHEIQISSGAELLENPQSHRPHYVAIGDSITHGTGLPSPTQTWPWQLAQSRNWSLTNLAVGGSKVVPQLAAMTAGQEIDVFTVLIGYNDWNKGTTEVDYRNKLSALVEGLRAHHPKAHINCLPPLAARKGEEGPHVQSGTTLESYRDVVRTLVRDRRANGDSQIFVIETKDIFAVSDTRDGVHPSIAGAEKLARHLAASLVSPQP
ncbi:MAG: hypothetical protein SynsKO_30010 [Synoicihabitans sp.]